MKTTQGFFTKFLATVIDREVFTTGAIPLRVKTLELVSSHCMEKVGGVAGTLRASKLINVHKPSAIRPVDASHIWILLARFLSPSKVHDDVTSTTTYLSVINIISGLIRLRRDLLSTSLPHLGSVLRLLVQGLKQPRPLLGSKQTEMVAMTLPRWIRPADPLDLTAAQALARLLEAMCSKTIVRNRSSSEEVKAESLARPFSKHAAYVLKAYVDMMNDPLCVVSLEVRRALQPGLFALCSMMGPHNRDALMVSAFDVGGMALMKALWGDFEKQRYVGKG